MQNPLWEYVLGIYGAEGVAPACLVLQDRFGVDVNLLLYAAWLAHSHLRLETAHLVALEASVGDWREQVVRPLRRVREQLRGTAVPNDFYETIKALELRAEREQMDRMYACFRNAHTLPAARQPLRENLQAVAIFTRPGEKSWEPAIDTLVALIPV